METVDDTRAIHTWIVGGDLLLRLLSPGPGRGFAPFIAAGGGVVSYGFGKGPPVVITTGPGEQVRYPGDTERRYTVSGGIGFDIIPEFTIFGTPSAIRLEAIDHVALKSPFTPMNDGSFDPVHNLRVSIGILGLVHLLR